MKRFIKKYKYVLIGLLIVLVAGVCYGLYEYMRKPAKAADLGADFALTADALQQEFETNEEAATKKYNDKVIEVSGTISDIMSNEKRTDISLETPDPMVAVTVQVLPEDNEKVKKYKTGDRVKLKGICTGKVTDIELNKGTIIEEE